MSQMKNDRIRASAGPAAPYFRRKQRTTMSNRSDDIDGASRRHDPPALGADLSSQQPPRSISGTTNARELRMRPQNEASGLSDKTSWWSLVSALRAAIFSSWPEPRERRYRPERHYMRGPGPKWRAKHGHYG